MSSAHSQFISLDKNNGSILAIGDENGCVVLYDTDKYGSSAEISGKKSWSLIVQVHC